MEKSLWRNIRRGVLIILLVGIFFQARQPQAAQAATQSPILPSAQASSSTGFNEGDLIVAPLNVQPYEVIDPVTGATRQTLDINGDERFNGMCFDGLGSLYVTQFGAGTVAWVDPTGNAPSAPLFISGLNFPQTCTVNQSQHTIYVGTDSGISNGQPFSGSIYEYDQDAHFVTSFTPAQGGSYGILSLALDTDGCMMYYTSGTATIYRFDVCIGQQLPDFATISNGAFCDDILILPTGQILVACSGDVYLLNQDGSVARTYPNLQFAVLALDPGGTSFWGAPIGDGSTLYDIDIATGNLISQISLTDIFGIASLAIFGAAGTIPVHPIIFLHGLAQNADDMGLPQSDPANDQFVPLYQHLESVYGPANINTFSYVDDKALETGNQGVCPAGIYPPCQSQSAVADNADQLISQIEQLYAQTGARVSLIGYSMGAAIIRTALAECFGVNGCDPSSMVSSVFFIEGDQQGSWLLQVKAGLDASKGIPALGSVANDVGNAVYNEVQAKLGLNLNYPAEQDLTPLSANIQFHNANLPPEGISYFNFYGDVQLQEVLNLGPFGTFNVGPPIPIGDFVQLPGDDDPQARPLWGGTRFCMDCTNQIGYASSGNYTEWALTDVQPVSIDDLDTDIINVANAAPEMHLNIDSDQALNGISIVVRDTTRPNGGYIGLVDEILLQLELEDGIA